MALTIYWLKTIYIVYIIFMQAYLIIQSHYAAYEYMYIYTNNAFKLDSNTLISDTFS